MKMKIDINDPRITAFALGELQGRDAVEIAQAVRSDARIRAAVDEVRETSSILLGVLGDGEVDRLTEKQLQAVRRAGDGPTIAELPSARVPFWKKPWVAGVGVAAAVALMLFLVADRPESGRAAHVTDAASPSVTASARAVASAMNEGRENYRQEVARRIRQSDLEQSSDLLADTSDARGGQWFEVASGKGFEVPMVSGASSWPWLHRYLNEQNTLPPRSLVRIEEMVNHFQYKAPSMMSGGGMMADMELCSSPWNSDHYLLAVHIGVQSEVEAGVKASLEMSQTLVRKVRLLGYAQTPVSAQNEGAKKSFLALPDRVSSSHGNYVIYELVAMSELEGGELPWATLMLGKNNRFPVSSPVSWANASADLRFASVVAASGMLLKGEDSAGKLNSAQLRSWIGMLETDGDDTLSVDRREALKLIRKALELLD